MDIEKFFLNTLLRISITGVFFILFFNVVLLPEDTLSISISAVVLLSGLLTYLMRDRYPVTAILFMTSVTLMAMAYQRLETPGTNTSLAVILVVGLIISILLKGRSMWLMHTMSLIILNTVFIFDVEAPITTAVTHSTLYIILTYATWILKSNYDKINKRLKINNTELHEKTHLIAHQNEDLEKIVNERTNKIQLQNQILVKYSYTNAHQLRGPVARLLGLATIYKLEPVPDPDFIIAKMVSEANEIDFVIKQINKDLDAVAAETN